jgi:N-acetylglucosamine repressor
MASPYTARRARHDHPISVNSKVVRNINRAVILNVIRERQPISRVRIAELTKLNKSTVSSIVASLLAEEIIAEESHRSQSVGRTPISLRLRTGRHFVGAINFDSATTRIAVVDIDGTVKHTTEICTEAGQPEAFVTRCLNELETLRKRHHFPHFTGLGITVAGIVDSAHSRVVFAPNLRWDDLDLGALVRAHANDIDNITIENDAKASALAELWFGQHDINLSSFVFLSVGRGIGTGIVIDKRILNGQAHAAGEFGHMTLIEDGEPCACGNRGCWEAYASDRATVRRFAAASGLSALPEGGPGLDVMIQAATNGDALARQELVRTAHYLGLGISNIIKAVDPHAIIIGGRITQVWDMVSPAILEAVTARAFFGKQGHTTILPTSLRQRPALLGAAALTIRQFFTDFRVTL